MKKDGGNTYFMRFLIFSRFLFVYKESRIQNSSQLVRYPTGSGVICMYVVETIFFSIKVVEKRNGNVQNGGKGSKKIHERNSFKKKV